MTHGFNTDNVFDDPSIAYVSIFVVIFGALAAGGGVGSSSIFLPIFAFLLRSLETDKGAIPLSKATVLGIALGNFWNIARSHHPSAYRPLVDYDFSVAIQPSLVMGTVFGVIFNILFPSVFISMSISVILATLSYIVGARGLQTYRMETKTKNITSESLTQSLRTTPDSVALDAELADASTLPAPPSITHNSTHPIPSLSSNSLSSTKQPLNLSPTSSSSSLTSTSAPKASSQDITSTSPALPSTPPSPSSKAAPDKTLDQLLIEDAEQFPLAKYGILCSVVAFVAMCSYLASRVIEHCNGGYWVVQLLPIPFLASFTGHYINQLHKKHEEKLALGYQFHTGDVQWNQSRMFRLPVAGLITGLLAGMLGLGGGMMINPLMLELGMDPLVSMGTGIFLMMFTSFSSVIHYYIEDRLPFSFLCWFVFIGFLAGLVEQILVKRMLRITGRASLVLFGLSGILAISTLVMIILMAVTVANDDDGSSYEFDTSAFNCD